MPLETVNIVVSGSDWVQIGNGVSALTVTENLVGNMHVHIVAAGGAAPSSGSSWQDWDREYQFAGVSADIYVRSPNGATTVGVVRA